MMVLEIGMQICVREWLLQRQKNEFFTNSFHKLQCTDYTSSLAWGGQLATIRLAKHNLISALGSVFKYHTQEFWPS